MPQKIVERILRDVLHTLGVRVSLQQVERTANGWRIVVIDSAQRVLTTDIPNGSPATIRVALTRWVDTATDPM